MLEPEEVFAVQWLFAKGKKEKQETIMWVTKYGSFYTLFRMVFWDVLPCKMIVDTAVYPRRQF
jgi:hypothetical protein